VSGMFYSVRESGKEKSDQVEKHGKGSKGI